MSRSLPAGWARSCGRAVCGTREIPRSGPGGCAASRVETALLALWVDEEPVSMAGFPAHTRNGVRIGYVYTPEARRRRGYATTLVAELSSHALDLGFSHCVLYTDLANPTSNRIYRSVGFRPLQDVMDVEFG